MKSNIVEIVPESGEGILFKKEKYPISKIALACRETWFKSETPELPVKDYKAEMVLKYFLLRLRKNE